MSIIPFDPATLVQIKIGDVSAPVAVGVELSKLYLTTDEIIRRLLLDVGPDAETGKLYVPFDLLPWFKEQRMLLSEIHKLTGEVEDKTNMKKLEIQGELFKQLIKDLPQEKKVALIKVLKNNANQL